MAPGLHVTAAMPLQRVLGWPVLTLYGLGAILGAGIYSVIGAAAERSGPGLWLAFVASAAVALLTALSYAELATMYPKAGAEFVYLRKAFPRQALIAFATGIMICASGAATMATVAIAFAGYLQAFMPAPVALVSPILLVVMGGIAIVGVKESAWTTAVFTCIEAAGLILVIAVGTTSETFGDALATLPTFGIVPGAALVFFSYLGFETIANLAEEAKQPERDLPRAILLSVVIATVIYVLVALATLALLSPTELASSDAPLADAVRARSPLIARVLGGIALFATANTAMASIVSASRVLYAMAEAKQLPSPLAAVASTRKTPWVATLVIVGAGLALLTLGRIDVVASVSSFASLLAFGSVNVAVLVLRRREPDATRPFRVPSRALPVIAAIATLVLVTQLELVAIAVGSGLLVLAAVGYRALHGSAR